VHHPRRVSLQVQPLLAAKAALNHADNAGETALMTAVLHKRTATVEALLASPGIAINMVSNSNGESALMLACSDHQHAAMRALVGAGADVDLQDAIGRTALVRAVAQAGEEPKVRRFEGRYVDDDDLPGPVRPPPRAGDRDSVCPMATLQQPAADGIAGARDSLAGAASAPKLKKGQSKQDIEAGHQSQWFESSMQIVQLLLEQRANVGLKDHHGVTALDVAKENKASTIVKLLQKEVAKAPPHHLSPPRAPPSLHVHPPPSLHPPRPSHTRPTAPHAHSPPSRDPPRGSARAGRGSSARPEAQHPLPRTPRARAHAPASLAQDRWAMIRMSPRGKRGSKEDTSGRSDSGRNSAKKGSMTGSSKDLLATPGAPATSHEDIDVAAEKPPGGGCGCALL
jgi:hypothetical protein